MSAAFAKLEAGRVVGRWTLEEAIGRGGFSEVWRARSGDEVVALKLLVHDVHGAALQKEATALGVVRGEGIVRTIEAGLDATPPYLALDLLAGGDLRARLAEAGGRFRPSEALLVVERILEVLARVHREGVVHADMKPENVLFDAEGSLHLSDFGLSRRISQQTATLSVSLSLADARLAGTLDYMAPEQREGAKPTPGCDVFAVGVILHELLLGERPLGVLAKPSERDEHLPPLVDRVLARALAANPRDRYPHAGAFLKDLRVELWNDGNALVRARAGIRERISLADAWPFLWAIFGGCLALGSVVATFDSTVRDRPFSDDHMKGLAVAAAVLLPLAAIMTFWKPYKTKLKGRLARVESQLEMLKSWREVNLSKPPVEWSREVRLRRARIASGAPAMLRRVRYVLLLVRRWRRRRARARALKV